MNYDHKKRYHRIDAWRGHMIPSCALVGASDTGTCSDSPCRTEDAIAEITRFRLEVLRPLRIQSRMRFGATSNVFCAKRWLVVSPADFSLAAEAAVAWLSEHDHDLHLLHDADLNQCEVTP